LQNYNRSLDNTPVEGSEIYNMQLVIYLKEAVNNVSNGMI